MRYWWDSLSGEIHDYKEQVQEKLMHVKSDKAKKELRDILREIDSMIGDK